MQIFFFISSASSNILLPYLDTDMGDISLPEPNPDALLPDRSGTLLRALALLPVQLGVHRADCGGGQWLRGHPLRVHQKTVSTGPSSR